MSVFFAHDWHRRAGISLTRFFRCGACGLVFSVGGGGIFFRRAADRSKWAELKPRVGSLAVRESRADMRLALEREPSCVSPFVVEQMRNSARGGVLDVLRARAVELSLPDDVRRARRAVKAELSRQRAAEKRVRI